MIEPGAIPPPLNLAHFRTHENAINQSFCNLPCAMFSTNRDPAGGPTTRRGCSTFIRPLVWSVVCCFLLRSCVAMAFFFCAAVASAWLAAVDWLLASVALIAADLDRMAGSNLAHSALEPTTQISPESTPRQLVGRRFFAKKHPSSTSYHRPVTVLISSLGRVPLDIFYAWPVQPPGLGREFAPQPLRRRGPAPKPSRLRR